MHGLTNLKIKTEDWNGEDIDYRRVDKGISDSKSGVGGRKKNNRKIYNEVVERY